MMTTLKVLRLAASHWWRRAAAWQYSTNCNSGTKLTLNEGDDYSVRQQDRYWADEAPRRELSMWLTRKSWRSQTERESLDKIAIRYSALSTPIMIDKAPLGLDDMGSPIFNSVNSLNDH
jgi:hypothetical protein